MFTKRQGLVIWFQHMKNIRQIKRYGHLVHASKKHKYALLYVNQDEIEDVMTKLSKLHYIQKVEPSYKPFIRTEYENSKPDKAKEYDYKYGSI
ncbi:hypothetical protein N780_00065 [Pontibacillus chungwhensis BH030062]|uniref:UPF0298 protein N780_00065 n=2 Tax=Pontibacillus TaxID=289201 RepID=A0A0A2UZP7_9BACI|nr:MULTISPECIES: DUF2129 domain-containing protein [Pontibacillus]KGP92031.1 hypothetical protein N780_00065 [Pontibacillus chungwhensis BH030062]QST01471.1 DUF2129 domain-containing protein [Pontibacillus sp. ALD_SL1]GGD19256.1 UPF0298 protein [Pontibacillus salipaludis]